VHNAIRIRIISLMMKKKTEIVSLRKGTSEIELNYADLRKAVLVLRAVNHKLTQHVIDLLEEHATMTVTDIYIKLRLEQSVASQHLAILRRAGVVRVICENPRHKQRQG